MTKASVNQIAYNIVSCAIEVQKQVGIGLLESVYEACLVHELRLRGLSVKTQVQIPLNYKGLTLDTTFRLDLLVEDCIIVEIKAIDELAPIHEAQLLTYLKLLEKPKGLLINFHSSNITKSLKSFVTEQFKNLPES